MTFEEKCYDLTSQIPAGSISTYKEVAKALNTKAYRAVGSAMAKNPNPIIVPCHRVIKSNGDVGLYSYKEGIKTKIALLQNEGIDLQTLHSAYRAKNFATFFATACRSALGKNFATDCSKWLYRGAVASLLYWQSNKLTYAS